jgi:hypothetical protein
MKIRNRFVSGDQYSIGGRVFKCVILVEYGRQLFGVQKAILEHDGTRYVAIRWPDGEVNRITKA